MSNPSRKLRRKIRKTHPKLREDCIFWIDENDVPVEPEHAPEHDLECVFSGGLDTSACFTCYLVGAAKHVWNSGRPKLTIHTEEPGADFVLVADTNLLQAEPWARLARGDGSKVAIYGPVTDTSCECGAHGAQA